MPFRLRSAAACAAAFLLASCSSSVTTTTTAASGAASSAPASSKGTVKIGIDLPMSGADASDGKPTANGALLAIEDAQARGFAKGAYKLEADVLDDAAQGKHDPAAGAQNVKTFIADAAVLAMLGPFNSNVAKSQIPLTNDSGLAQISPATTSDELTSGASAQALRSAHPATIAFFRVCTKNSRQGTALANVAAKNGWKNVYVIDDDETYGKGLADVFVARVAANGGTVVGRDHIVANQQDFKALLTKVRSLAPQAVFFGGTTSTGAGLIRRQMGDVGLAKLPFLGGDGISDQEFITVAGPQADGTLYTVAAADANRLPSARAFVAAYRKRFGSAVGPYSANGYAAAQVAIAAIEKAIAADGGALPTRAEVLQNVASTHGLVTPIGSVGFNGNGDITTPILSLIRIAGGKPQTVDQITLQGS